MSKKDKTSSNLNKNKRINLEVQQCQCVLFESCIHCTTVQEFKTAFFKSSKMPPCEIRQSQCLQF